MSLNTGNAILSNAITVDSSYNVGIGQASPSYKLDVTGTGRFNGGKSQLTLDGGASAGAGLLFNTSLSGSDRRNWFIGTEENVAGDFVIKSSSAAGGNANSGTTRIAILSNGNIGMGTTNPDRKLSVVTSDGVEAARFTDGSRGDLIVGFPSAGVVMLTAEYGTGGALAFGSGTGRNERMRIAPSGVLLLGSTSNPSNCKVYVEQDISSGNGILMRTPTDSGSWGYLRFMNSGFINIGGIFQTSSTTLQYATSSDYRLKEDLKDFNGLDKVSSIKVYDFKWKESDDRMEGVLAHELQEVIPYAVNGEKDGLDEDGNIRMQGVDYSLIVPTLIKAIQELKAEVDTLKQLVK